jgi:hypothetical protein
LLKDGGSSLSAIATSSSPLTLRSGSSGVRKRFERTDEDEAEAPDDSPSCGAWSGETCWPKGETGEEVAPPGPLSCMSDIRRSRGVSRIAAGASDPLRRSLRRGVE